jgi:dedicator of cytokinesis protein 3
LPPTQITNATLSNGHAEEEASIMQPVAVRQGRGTRLSFLGSKKKDYTNGELHQHSNSEDNDTTSNGSRTMAKDNPNRRSFFRSHSAEANQNQRNTANTNDASEWVTDSGRDSYDTGGYTDKDVRESQGGFSKESGGGATRMGSVRKRLSLLKLGKKNSKGNGVMGSLDEE